MDDDSEVVGHWFKHDVQAMLDEKFERISGSEPDNPSDNPSWYAMLCGVVTSSIHQFILLNLGYQSAGGKTDKYDRKVKEDIDNFDKTNVAKLLMRIPTEWNRGSLFPIYDLDLEEWKSHFEKVDFQGRTEPITVPEKEDRALNAQYHDMLTGNVDDLMEDETLEDDMKDAMGLAEKDKESILDMLATTGVDKAFFLESDFLDAGSYPSARVRDPEWTPWLSAMASTNIYGQLALMYRRVHAVQQGANILSLAFKHRAAEMEEHKKQLCEKAIQLREAMQVVTKGQERNSIASGELRSLEAEIAAGKSIPAVRKYMSMMSDRAIRTGSPSLTYTFILYFTYSQFQKY